MAATQTPTLSRMRVPRLLSSLPPGGAWRRGEALIRLALFAAASFAIFATVAIGGVLLFETLGFFQHVSAWNFFTGLSWSPDIEGLFGVVPLVTATLLVAGGSALIGIPIGLAAAVYLREYAPAKVRAIVKPALEVLAGIPTVVYGFFAILTISPILQRWFGADFFNGMNAIIVIGIMIIPLVSSLSEDALTAVPVELRDGALALGATRFEAMSGVVVRAAFSGIVASFILAFSRAIGETMVVAIAAGATPQLTLDPFRSIETMTAFIAIRSTGDLPVGSVLFQSLFAVGFTLFLMTLALNALSSRLMARVREVYA